MNQGYSHPIKPTVAGNLGDYLKSILELAHIFEENDFLAVAILVKKDEKNEQEMFLEKMEHHSTYIDEKHMQILTEMISSKESH
jgi:hypothetical protein